MIIGKNIYLNFDASVIYDDASFCIPDNVRVGVVGVNGAGKSTLFKMIMGMLKPDGGVLSVNNRHIGYLPQEINTDDIDMTVWDYLLSGRPLKYLSETLKSVYERVQNADAAQQELLLKQAGDLQDEQEFYDIYNAEDVLLELIEKMNIPDSWLDMKLGQLSGGQKSKVAFTRVLYSKPEILLLDEPTNHLDVDTRDFVISFLKNYKNTVVIISHDIDFLNQIIDRVLFVDKTKHKICMYNGDYNDYLQKYSNEKHLKEQNIQKQEREIKELQDFVRRAEQASPTNHSLKRMGLERAAKLEKKIKNLDSRDIEYKHVKFNIQPIQKTPAIPVIIDNLSFRYIPKQKLFYRNLSFQINAGERFLVVGENGVGKSTLIKLIMNMLDPVRGEIKFDKKTDVAYYAQELEILDQNKSIMENLDTNNYSEQDLRTILSNFLFFENDIFKPVNLLSPGEKARVGLCKILLKRANFLILDEPTNHLDPDTQKIIGENFRDYNGTILMVSHNPSFVEQIGVNRMLVLPDGQIKEYSHELLEYYYDLNTPEWEK